jgi:ribosomal protein S18 acetylase RimI-like enzyme
MTVEDAMNKAFSAVGIRPATHEDVNDLVRIDNASYISAWSARKFHNVLENNRDTSIFVAGHHNQGANAYVIYELLEKSVVIKRMAAYPEYGELLSALVGKLKKLLHVERRTSIIMYVPETHLATQILLRDHGFRADGRSIVRNHFQESNEDAYIMQHKIGFLTMERSNIHDTQPTEETLCQLEDAPGSGN